MADRIITSGPEPLDPEARQDANELQALVIKCRDIVAEIMPEDCCFSIVVGRVGDPHNILAMSGDTDPVSTARMFSLAGKLTTRAISGTN